MEASRIDDIVDTTFECESVPCCLFNKYPLCSLQPKDAAIIQTYSDAKNQLTGIIDTPDMRDHIVEAFQKTLTWVVLHEIRDIKNNQNQSNKGHSRPGTARSSHFQSLHKLNNIPSETKDNGTVGGNSKDLLAKNNKLINPKRSDSHRQSIASELSFGAAAAEWSDTESIFSATDEPKNASGLDSNRQHTVASRIRKINMVDPQSSEELYDSDKSNSNNRNLNSYSLDGQGVDDLFNELGLGMPAEPSPAANQPTRELDTHHSPPVMHSNSDEGRLPLISHQTNSHSLMRLFDPSKLVSPFSLQLAPLTRWLEVPQSALRNSTQGSFSREWFQHVVRLLPFKGDTVENSRDVAEEVAQDEQLCKVYEQFVSACHTIVNVMGECVS